MKFLFIMDPLGSINRETDSSLLMMREAFDRGHTVYYCTIEDLYIEKTVPKTSFSKTAFVEGEELFCLTDKKEGALGSFDAVFMRKDPPFDMNYVYSTYLLDLASKDTFIINHPSGIRKANEKLYALNFPDAIPESIVTNDRKRLTEFLHQVGGEIIIKPLGKCGGEGIFYIHEGDKNINSLIEMSTRFGKELIMAQRYLPEIKEGDKRIILLDGKPLGAVSRIPQDNEHRGNIHIGGTGKKSEITERDRELCTIVSPKLKEDGLYFVGLDVIGNWITEINVTSPTCLVEINKLNGVKLEKDIIDFVEGRII